MLNHPVYQKLKQNIDTRKNAVCVGLDPDLGKMPAHFPKSVAGVEAFLTGIIEATQDYCIAYKPNLSFFEALGIEGIACLERLRKRIPSQTPVIIDGKRGDIGNTSAKQAAFLVDVLGADATTLHPYMGEDSLTPFFERKDQLHFVLGLTSNPGAATFEKQLLANGQPLYTQVIAQCETWAATYQNLGLVVGGTQSEMSHVRHLSSLPFLIPGVGAQGGDYQTAFAQGKDANGVAIVSMSRSLLYAVDSPEFATQLRQRCQQNQW